MRTNQNLSLLYEMAVFARVVETGSFSEAARQLAITPSATSRAVARLEKALASRLLHRTTRKLSLSESGQVVYIQCQQMLSAAESVMGLSDQFNPEPQGVIRLSVPKAVGRFLIHPHIIPFLTLYPQVDVQLMLDDRYRDLIDDQIDLALRITNHPPAGLMGRRLQKISHLLCATPRYLAQHGLPQHPRELKTHSCICLGEHPRDAHWQFTQGTKTTRVKVNGRYSANHTGVRLDAALQHIGIASLPDFTARQALLQGTLVQVLPDWTFQTYYSGDLWLLYAPTRYLAPRLSAFVTYLSQALNPQQDRERKLISDSLRPIGAKPADEP